MQIIVGLGNPGRRYEATRHNTGFMVADRLADSLHAPFSAGKGDFYVALGEVGETPVAVMKPTTYMNNSGIAVHQAVGLFGTSYDHVLIVCDDFQIPLGTIRFRARGSDGGHNGIASVLYHAGTDLIHRLRCGIGDPRRADDDSAVAYVLAPFEAEEEPAVRSMIDRSVEGIRTYVIDGIDAAMNTFNRHPENSG